MSTWPPTLTETKAALNKADTTDDTELQSAIDAAVAMLENHPAYRVVDAAKSTAYTEWHDGGVGEVVLKHYPLTADPTVTEYRPNAYPLTYEPLDTTSNFTSLGFDYTARNGIVCRTIAGRPSIFAGRVKVTYTAGVAVAPADLHEAALLLVDHLWETQRGGAGADAPPGLDIDEQGRTFGSQFGPSYAMPNRVRELLEPYRADALA